MSRTITLSVDQLYRPQPGGIATYVRGLAQGLAVLDDRSIEVLGLAPRGPDAAAAGLELALVRAALGVRLLTRVWPHWPVGVPRRSDVVHATSMAGPFAGGAPGAVHSVALHDLLWRDEPGAATASGIAFHERRLRLIASKEDLRVFVTSPGLKARLVDEGIDAGRVHEVRLGVDDDDVAASRDEVGARLADHGVTGPFTLYAGTLEPRKNIARLLEAHAAAFAADPRLGRLVLVGPGGWGTLDAKDAVVLGLVSRALLKGLYRDAAVFAYVPRAEGWGLPPVEALHAGTRVVASSTTPSVRANPEVVRVDPLDVDAIAQGLLDAVGLDDTQDAASARRASVAGLTWRNVALDHLAGWR